MLWKSEENKDENHCSNARFIFLIFFPSDVIIDNKAVGFKNYFLMS